MVPIALAEPTPVGEVVVAGTAIVLSVVFVVKLAEYAAHSHQRKADEELCQRFYEKCIELREGWMPCADCRSMCNLDGGIWPGDKCKIPGFFD